MTFCAIIHIICFIIACFLLIVGLFAPNRFSGMCRVETVLATALVAWLCTFTF